ncbi:MAG: hypothetical protein ACO3FE_16660, partial [Planctomycetaceae bacterium]
YGVTVDEQVLQGILQRYETENRERRCSEPRDLIERMRDLSRYRNDALEISQQSVDIAWRGFFGVDE